MVFRHRIGSIAVNHPLKDTNIKVIQVMINDLKRRVAVKFSNIHRNILGRAWKKIGLWLEFFKTIKYPQKSTFHANKTLCFTVICASNITRLSYFIHILSSVNYVKLMHPVNWRVKKEIIAYSTLSMQIFFIIFLLFSFIFMTMTVTMKLIKLKSISF